VPQAEIVECDLPQCAAPGRVSFDEHVISVVDCRANRLRSEDCIQHGAVKVRLFDGRSSRLSMPAIMPAATRV
jgi:hypothetical protein